MFGLHPSQSQVMFCLYHVMCVNTCPDVAHCSVVILSTNFKVLIHRQQQYFSLECKKNTDSLQLIINLFKTPISKFESCIFLLCGINNSFGVFMD